jgi:hypothetical protein
LYMDTRTVPVASREMWSMKARLAWVAVSNQ